MNQDIVDITFDNAQKYLIDESMQRLVVIDFWADWCAPCKALLPVLTKLVNEYKGAFLLAKVDSDKLGEIAAQFGIRSLPTVILMKDGQPVDAFQGAQPESQVRKLLEKHLPKPWDTKLQKAQKLLEDGKFDEALPVLRQAYEESKHRADIALALAHAALQTRRLEEAEKVLQAVKLADRDHMYEQLLAQLELAAEAAKTPEIRDLEAKLNENPDDMEVAFELAVKFGEEKHYKEALELLMTVLTTDRQFRDGAARKMFLDILATLGKGDPLAVQFQRRFYNLIY